MTDPSHNDPNYLSVSKSGKQESLASSQAGNEVGIEFLLQSSDSKSLVSAESPEKAIDGPPAPVQILVDPTKMKISGKAALYDPRSSNLTVSSSAVSGPLQEKSIPSQTPLVYSEAKPRRA